jgi:3-oxoacyl-[acyl-carrier protein] reductase
MSQKQKSVIVTGASRGIGRAIALRLAADGFAVTVNYASSQQAADEVVAQIKSAGGAAIAVGGDVAKAEDVSNLFDQTERAFGQINAIVNNAGVMKTVPIVETDEEAFDSMFATNVRGTFLMLRAAAKRLPVGGRIVNFSTSAIALRLPGYATYCATKAAVEAYTSILANELRGKQITVNAIAPGPTGTDLFLDGKSPEQIDRLAKMNPFERLGTPDDIASAVSILLGPEGAWINGQTIRVNGGMA